MSCDNRSGPCTGSNNREGQFHREATVPLHRGTGQLVDGLALWQSEVTSIDRFIVPTIRIDENERLLIPFTTSLARVQLHYLDSQSFRGYVHCTGPDCLLCRVGRTTETRDLVPMYDLMEKSVGVLLVSTSLRPNALRPQVLPVLKRVESAERPFLMTVKKMGTVTFIVTTTPLPESADDGASIIAQFQAGIDSGAINLSSAFPRIDNAVLQEIPEIAIAVAAKGIVLCPSKPSHE